MKQFAPFLKFWRATSIGDREIVDAVVSLDHVGPSTDLQAELDRWPGIHYWVRGDGLDRLVLIRTLADPKPEQWLLHGFLFALTFFTVLMAGAALAGSPVHFAPWTSIDFVTDPARMSAWFAGLLPGLEFAVALMAVLLAHELGHYFAARAYSINASPPYFIPAPLLWNFIGTFGAFIRIRSPIVDRRQLMDVGAAGPWVGFVVAFICLAVGMANSTVVHLGGTGQLLAIGSAEIPLGDSLVVAGVRNLFGSEGMLLLHPLAFAGWIGMFVTTLNLLPMGQLDGGHVLYALIGDRQKLVGWLMWFALLALGFHFVGWWIWALLTLVLGKGGMGHPSVMDRYRPIPRSRTPIGWATVVLFVLTFTPVPFVI